MLPALRCALEVVAVLIAIPALADPPRRDLATLRSWKIIRLPDHGLCMLALLLALATRCAAETYVPRAVYAGRDIKQVLLVSGGFLSVADDAYVLEKDGAVVRFHLSAERPTVLAAPGSFESIATDGCTLYGLKGGGIQTYGGAGFWRPLELGGIFKRKVSGIWAHESVHVDSSPYRRLYYQTARGELFARDGNQTRKLGSFPRVRDFAGDGSSVAFLFEDGGVLLISLSSEIKYDTVHGPAQPGVKAVAIFHTPQRIHLVAEDGAVHLFQNESNDLRTYYRELGHKLTVPSDFNVIDVARGYSASPGVHLLGRDGSLWRTYYDDGAWADGGDTVKWGQARHRVTIPGARFVEEIADLHTDSAVVATRNTVLLMVDRLRTTRRSGKLFSHIDQR